MGLGPVVAFVVAVGGLDVVLRPPQREVAGLPPQPLAHRGELAGGRELVRHRLAVLGVTGSVDDHEVGPGLVPVPVREGVQDPPVHGAPGALQRVGGLLVPRVDAVHAQVRAADQDVAVDLLQRPVDQVVHRRVPLVVPAAPGVVPEALELVPDEEVTYVGVAPGDGRGEVGEVLVVVGGGRRLQGGPAPVGAAGAAALHPVRRAAQRDHGRAAGGADEVDTAVQRAEVPTPLHRFGVVRAPAHDRLVLGQPGGACEASLHACRGVRGAVVGAVLGVGEAPADGGCRPSGRVGRAAVGGVAVPGGAGGAPLAGRRAQQRHDQGQHGPRHAEQGGEAPPPIPRIPPTTAHRGQR